LAIHLKGQVLNVDDVIAEIGGVERRNVVFGHIEIVDAFLESIL
jgi:hypothetical protein